MVQEDTGNTMRFEVESRLDDLFGESEGAGDEGSSTDNDPIQDTFLETEDVEPEEIDVFEEAEDPTGSVQPVEKQFT